MMNLLVEIEFHLRSLALSPGARVMAATLTCGERYLNAQRLIWWSEEVIADPTEIK
jgi:hypothetical protein